MKLRVALFAFVLNVLASVAGADRAVTVFAAASLSGALDEIAAGYDGAVVVSYGGSGVMARQVAAGAPADVVILANPVWMAWLADQGIVAAQSPMIIAKNSLVVIGAQDAKHLKRPADLPARLGDNRLAMGQRDAVPAGTYARQWLQSAGVWQAVAPRLAETDNVRAALALVAAGQTPFGIVYLSDAQADAAVRIIYDIPAESHDPILYPAAALTPKGQGFLTHLNTPAAAALLTAHGFGPPTP